VTASGDLVALGNQRPYRDKRYLGGPSQTVIVTYDASTLANITE
jgi:hypothetical protein